MPNIVTSMLERRRIRRFPDELTARGIFDRMDINSVQGITIDSDDYQFVLDEFKFKIEARYSGGFLYDYHCSLYIDGVELSCSQFIKNRIYDRCRLIKDHDKIENERLVRKDAKIHFSK